MQNSPSLSPGGPGASHHSWWERWSVRTDEATRSISAEFNGESTHETVTPNRPTLSGDPIPKDFAIGVIYGCSASGKSQLLAEIRADINSGRDSNVKGAQSSKEEIADLRAGLMFDRGQAIVSKIEEACDGKPRAGLERLGSVGINDVSVPCLRFWLKLYSLQN